MTCMYVQYSTYMLYSVLAAHPQDLHLFIPHTDSAREQKCAMLMMPIGFEGTSTISLSRNTDALVGLLRTCSE